MKLVKNQLPIISVMVILKKTTKISGGEHHIDIPRDHNAEFEPVLVPKNKSMSQDLEDCIMLLYAKGMSN